jgi:DUF4097 and DUF4098 domain-containing protein YvlB
MTSDTRPASIDHAIGPTGQLTVKVATSDIRLRPSSDDHVHVRSADGGPLPDDVKIETGVNSLSIRQVGRFLGVSLSFGEARSVALEVELPTMAEAVVQTASGAVTSTGLHGEQNYRSASGDIRLERAGGRIATETVSGDVTIGVDRTIELSVKSVSGDVAIDGEMIERLRLTTTSGDIRLVSSLGAGPHAIETLSGDALIATDSGVRIQARTISGDLRSDLPHSSDGMIGRRSLTVGDGAAEMSFRSVSGDLLVVDPAAARIGSPGGSAVPTPPIPPTAIPPMPAMTAAIVTEPVAPPARPSDDRRLEILRALERGEIDIAAATAQLGLLDESTDD